MGFDVAADARFGGIDLSPWGKFHRGLLVAYPLLFHMLDVAAIALELWDRFLTASQRRLIAQGLGVTLQEARSLVAFFAGCHDLGKLSAFQEDVAPAWARVSDALRADACGWERVSHERVSMHVAVELLAELGYEADTNASPAVRLAQCFGGHHGRFLQVDLHGAARPERVWAGLGGPLWQDLRRRYLAQVRYQTGAMTVPSRASVPAVVLITAVGTVADHLASQSHYWLPKAQAPAFGAGEHYAMAVKEAPEVVDASGLARVVLPEVAFTQAHRGLPGPNALQESLMAQLSPVMGEKGAGIVVVTDVTGGGKTVAGLELSRMFTACGVAGLSWLMPTTVTADATYEAVEAYVAAHRPERAPVAVVHSHSSLNAAYTDSRLAEQAAAAGDGYDLCDGEDGTDSAGEDGAGAAGASSRSRATAPNGWLRAWDRALLAQFTVATHDQALMAALPVRFSALRLLAMSGKTVIIDEAHALSAFSQLTMERLVHWLGAFRTPVVVLSATLPSSTSDRLIRSYLAGAGHSQRALGSRSFTPPYPGWLFAAAADATTIVMDPSARTAHTQQHRRRAAICLKPVRHCALGDPARTLDGDERLAVICEQLTPVAVHGGCAAVECATVADAQDTYRLLRHRLDWPDGAGRNLVLLHARLPAYRRDALTRRLRTALGPTGRRPERLIVVTTSMFDVGLDVDVDVLISDLASLARLLQRLGRLWRFENRWGPDNERRPPWVRKDTDPVFTVLQPVDAAGRTTLPAGWHRLEHDFLLRATADLLTSPAHHKLTVPDDIQPLVEQIHGDASQFAAAIRDLQQSYTRHQGAVAAEEHLSASHLIPPPGRVSSLADLHRQYLTARTAATRLGELPKRLLPCYRTRSGQLTLDRAGARPLPLTEKLSTRQIHSILRHTLPVPAAWVAHCRPEHRAPTAWRGHRLLADLILLPHDATQPDAAVRFGRHILRLDRELGLVHRRV